jgi:hypothetical protein
MEDMMNKTKLVLLVGMVMALMLACATFGGGDNQNNNQSNQQNQNEQNNDNKDNQENQNNNNADNNEENKNDNNAGNNDDEDTPPDVDLDLDPSFSGTEFGELLASGDLVIGGITANSDYDTVGTILTVQFTNTSNGEIIITLPCGLVFVPTGSDEQELMMIQPMDIELAAGETAEFTPYVVCIEMAAPAPQTNSVYSIGYLSADDLLTFAECICGVQLSSDNASMDAMGVQFAAWSVATGGDIMGIIEEEGGSFMEYMEGIEASEMLEMVTQMMDMFGGQWLDRCGITLEEN